MPDRPIALIDVREFLSGVFHLKTLEIGALSLLLMHYWMAGQLPSDPERLRRITRVSKYRWASVWRQIGEFFQVEGERLTPVSDFRAVNLRLSSSEWAALRKQIFARDNYTCQYCGAVDVPLDCDHVHPVSRGGSNLPENLATACASCNRSKSNKTVEEWLGTDSEAVS